MVLSGEHAGELSDPLDQRVDDLRAELREANPATLAARTRSAYHPAGDGSGKFRLSVWGQEVYVTFPDFFAYASGTDEQLPTFTQALLAYYFHISDGTAPSKSWIAFSEMPDGAFYAQAFQGYTGVELAKVFGNDAQAFERAAESLGGQREFFGNMAYSFEALPCVSLMVVCWLGDEDFPPSYRVLFDSSASHHLTTDGCAIVGSTLTRKLIKANMTRDNDYEISD